MYYIGLDVLQEDDQLLSEGREWSIQQEGKVG